jgi:hypothetical protein
MPALTPHAHRRFKLDRERFSAQLIRDREERFGFDSGDEFGFAAAIAARFEDAIRAGAILGPPDVEAAVYPIGRELLIVAVREADPDLPLRQLASFCFEAGEVACFGDERFGECCVGLEALLERASELLGSFIAMREAEGLAAAAEPSRQKTARG